MDIVNSVCETTTARCDEVQLLAGETFLDPSMILGQGECVAQPGPEEILELSVAIVRGPPVTAASVSGSRIEVMQGVPQCGEECHFDRDYTFRSLGDFAGKEGMHYIVTSNEDRKTKAHRVMWQLDIREPATVFLNFRSQAHIDNGRALDWLVRDGWEHNPDFKSTVSTGFPNGPYSGPVYTKTVYPSNRRCFVDLMGSNYWEGTYFVFVQMDSFTSEVV
jgi:hypothetical protein